MRSYAACSGQRARYIVPAAQRYTAHYSYVQRYAVLCKSVQACRAPHHVRAVRMHWHDSRLLAAMDNVWLWLHTAVCIYTALQLCARMSAAWYSVEC